MVSGGQLLPPCKYRCASGGIHAKLITSGCSCDTGADGACVGGVWCDFASNVCGFAFDSFGNLGKALHR